MMTKLNGPYSDDKILSNLEHELLVTFLDNLNVNFFVIDTEGRYVLNSPVLDEVIGHNKRADIVDKESWLSCKKVIETGQHQVVEERYKDIWFLSIKKPFLDKQGNIAGVLGISIDITDRKRAEAYRLKQEIAKKETESAQKTAEFTALMAGTIAHELRTPLSTISNAANKLSRRLPKLIATYELAKSKNLTVPAIRPRSMDGLKKVAQKISREVDFSTSIIDMMLMNIAGAKIDPRTFKRCSITNCIEEALERYPFVEEEKELVTFKKSKGFEFMGDTLLLVHVLFNLIKNALHYIAKAERGKITIWLEPSTKTRGVNKLYFKDTGSGIPKEILPQIFEHFFSKTYGGTGVGLSFCKTVMRGLGGDIICTSQKGKFTEFILTFPKI